jgi:hypothetical protein
MESDLTASDPMDSKPTAGEPTAEQALGAAERATAALWTDYPRTPSWYYPAAGVWAAAFVLTLGLTGASIPLLAAAAVGHAAVLALYTRWYTAYRGAVPRAGSAPPEFRRAIRAFVAGFVLLAAAVAVLFATVGSVVAAVVAGVGVGAGLVAYERAYEAAAAATRRRLG